MDMRSLQLRGWTCKTGKRHVKARTLCGTYTEDIHADTADATVIEWATIRSVSVCLDKMYIKH